MMSAGKRCGWGALLVVVIGCLGGQTGQPTVASCDGRIVGPDERLRGVTPDEFASAFEGTHPVALAWHTSAGPTDDELTLELRPHAPFFASLSCGEGELDVSMDVELRTRDHGVLATTSAVMRGRTGQRERAEILFQDSRVRFDADLVSVDGEVQLSGMLTTSDAELPATTGTFPAPEAAGGVGGGG